MRTSVHFLERWASTVPFVEFVCSQSFMEVTQLFKLGRYLVISQIQMYGKFETVLKYFKACLKSLNFMRIYICASRLMKGKAKHIYMRIALKGLKDKGN